MVRSFQRRACQNTQRLSKDTLLAFMVPGSKQRAFFDKMELSEWDIFSFDPSRKEACVIILATNIILTIRLQDFNLSENDVR